ncbi:hypothetical protein FHX82_005379 [Amycolatopsis bartoniae]|uniref:ClpX-type ZB domain-containing protein n=1 Tax=Amycolatopsis bartoniae TaxID=941986 RepID=A0A8H9IMK3_9PSEU|nr:hypothetical protein [Amycolatopsis bartoniae]MBB2938303.1 hypothetical protein [Amycolatopsis bartoniae]TVT09069.1 hypothetical protein FNH07_10585 [Amycolatopsis bartoniae]GHF34173.1 hypothetical protein GCM10017566_03570 [Amycolatopsis bartoniae]
MTAEAIDISQRTGTIGHAAPPEPAESTEYLVNGRTAPCRFCGRTGTDGVRRAPGPRGPICPDCLHVGTWLCRDGQERFLGELNLARLVTAPGLECEFCGRDERRTLFLRRRPLPRMRCLPGDAVICADCLARGQQLLACVSRVRRG